MPEDTVVRAFYTRETYKQEQGNTQGPMCSAVLCSEGNEHHAEQWGVQSGDCHERVCFVYTLPRLSE